MISIIDIKKAYISLIKSLYKNYKIFGLETKEGIVGPSFFIEISPIELGSGLNTRKNVLNVYTTYFQKEINEIDIYGKIETIREALGTHLIVKDRSISVSDFGFSLIGESKNILQIDFTLTYFENVNKKIDEFEKIQKLNIRR